MSDYATMNPANVGYLPGVVLKELKAGRMCEITGGLCTDVKDVEEYKKKRSRMSGKFAEVIQRTGTNRSLIATRVPPEWAVARIDETIWDCPEMMRWFVPKEER